MLTNPGFTFSGISGEHKIVPTSQTDLPIWGPNYTEAVICTYDGELVKVYDNGPGFGFTDESVAMEFAAIDINDPQQIIDFCNKNGMPSSMRQFGNFRNDYLFFEDDKDNFSKVIPLATHRERTWLFTIKRDIIRMDKCIKLNQAIQDADYAGIIEILLYFCFDLYGLDFKGSEPRTETFKFNHHFFLFAEENGYHKQYGLGDLSINDLISGFLADINAAVYEAEMYNAYRIPHNDKYVEIYFSLWQHLHGIFLGVVETNIVEEITPLGCVKLSSPISTEIMNDTDKDSIIKTAKGVFSDLFKENLKSVYPEIIFNKNGNPESSWRTPSLLDAMYLELFFRFTPNSSVRKCANPTCNKFFTRTSSRTTKIYCDDDCAKLMAKRNERARKKANK